MEPLLYLSMLVVALALTLVIVARMTMDRIAKLKDRVRELESSKQSLSTVYGRITEQWAPFMAGYPYDPRQFRFLGSPVDGVQFEEDKVVFVEFKTNGSALSPRQQRIRELVQQGRVEWLEFRLAAPKETAAPPASTSWGAGRAPGEW